MERKEGDRPKEGWLMMMKMIQMSPCHTNAVSTPKGLSGTCEAGNQFLALTLCWQKTSGLPWAHGIGAGLVANGG